MDDKFSALLGRLETVTSRLETMDTATHASRAATGGASGGGGGGGGGGAVSPSVEAYDAFVDAHVRPWVDAASKVSPDAAKQARHALAAFDAQRTFIVVASVCAKPSAEELPMLLAATSKAIGETQAAVDRRAADFNLLNAVGEGIAALGWVVVDPKPVPHIDEMKNASDFYSNKVLVQFRNEAGEAPKARVAFVTLWKELLSQLAAYVKEHHRTGLTWTHKGPSVSQYSAAHGGGAPTATERSAPQQPPAADAGAASGGTSSLFAQLNAGAGVTSGLRHVKKGDVGAPPVPVASVKGSAPQASAAAPGLASQGASKPARTQLEGKKWMVENYRNDPSVLVDSAKLSETVYVFRCEGSTIKVSSKVNQITLDSCKKTSVLLESAMAGIELVNCSGCKVQVLGSVATIAVDKSDGTQLILSREACKADIISAKSSELNIIVPGATDADEYKEHAIAEQFISKYVKGKYVTTAVEHTA